MEEGDDKDDNYTESRKEINLKIDSLLSSNIVENKIKQIKDEKGTQKHALHRHRAYGQPENLIYSRFPCN